MGERSYRNKIDAALGIVANSVEGNTSRRLGLVTATDATHRLTGEFGGEIVEHDAVDPSYSQHLLQLVEIAHLDFDFEVLAFFFEVFMTPGNGGLDATGKVDMIVFEQYHVEQADTVVHSATRCARPLFRAYACRVWSCGYRAHGYAAL